MNQSFLLFLYCTTVLEFCNTFSGDFHKLGGRQGTFIINGETIIIFTISQINVKIVKKKEERIEMMKKLLCLALVLCMVLSALPILAADTAPKAEPRHPVNDSTTSKFANLNLAFGRNYDPTHK